MAADGSDCGIGSESNGARARELAGYIGTTYDSESDNRFCHFFVEAKLRGYF